MEEGTLKKCRCCLEEDGLLNLWNEYKSYGNGIVYGVMIKECFSIPFKKLESEEEYICESCITRLMDAVSFKKEILASDSSLKAIINGKNRSILKQDIESDNEQKTEYLDIECLLDDNCQDLSEALFSDIDEDVETVPTNVIKPEINMEKESEENKLTIKKAVHMVSKTLKSKREKIIFKNSLEQITLNNITNFSNATPIKRFNGRAYECYFCPNNYEMPADLKIHTLAEHKHCEIKANDIVSAPAKIDVTDLICDICHTNVNLISDLCEHLKKEHDKISNDSVLNFLIPMNFKEEGFKCAICRASFLHFKLLHEHMNKHFKNYECERCGCFYMTKSSLRGHMGRHGRGEYKCSYCPKVFNTPRRVKQHIDQVHLKKKRNKCGYCGERFINIAKKKDHEFQVHGAKRQEFPCRACDKVFRTQKAMSRHIKQYHLMIRGYRCTMCDMQFCKSTELRSHMVKHTKSRNFVCSVCNKAYGRRSTLKEHMRIHLNDRRFKCNVCGSTFIQKCSLKSHVATKHPHSEV